MPDPWWPRIFLHIYLPPKGSHLRVVGRDEAPTLHRSEPLLCCSPNDGQNPPPFETVNVKISPLLKVFCVFEYIQTNYCRISSMNYACYATLTFLSLWKWIVKKWQKVRKDQPVTVWTRFPDLLWTFFSEHPFARVISRWIRLNSQNLPSWFVRSFWKRSLKVYQYKYKMGSTLLPHNQTIDLNLLHANDPSTAKLHIL